MLDCAVVCEEWFGFGYRGGDVGRVVMGKLGEVDDDERKVECFLFIAKAIL